ncbi:MAG: CRTAC1 family protein [Planctomycetaceae bacterium]|nr:CRTAC1 family protein [Planctomycetaceae bacterium]
MVWHPNLRTPAIGVIGAWVTLWHTGCDFDRPDAITKPRPAAAVTSPEVVTAFEDIGGLMTPPFVHRSGGESLEFPAIMGGGCAVADVDGDLRPDILLLHSGSEVQPTEADSQLVVYRQQTDGAFVADPAEFCPRGVGYGMGLAVGDINNDGSVDVYISRYGADQLLVNDGAGRFRDISQEAGISNIQWGTSVAMADLNRDGFLDIIVANYVDYFPGTFCADAAGIPDFCGPRDFHGTGNRVFLNTGRSSSAGKVAFEDVSAATGIGRLLSKSLGVICRDFDGDNQVDVFFANDGEPNHLWIQKDGEFTEQAASAGLAVNRFGEAEAGMGVVMCDFNSDAVPDLLVTHLSGEMNTLWQGTAGGVFRDVTSTSGIGIASLPHTGFGVIADDLDCDGRPDLLVANGRVKRNSRSPTPKQSDGILTSYAEHNQLYFSRDTSFLEVTDGPSGFTGDNRVSRGLAAGDFDSDGDLDLLVANIGAAAGLYSNQTPANGHWLCIRLIDRAINRDAYGARVELRSGDRSWSAELLPHQSYLSSSQAVLHFGLGAEQEIDEVRVYWPDGSVVPESFVAGSVNRILILERGQGRLTTGVVPGDTSSPAGGSALDAQKTDDAEK